MVIRITSVVLSFARIVVALILGLLVWANSAFNLIQMHMLLRLFGSGHPLGHRHPGGIFQGQQLVTRGLCPGSRGCYDDYRSESVSAHAWPHFHWVVQIIHLVLGFLVIGLGHIGAARYRKSAPRAD